jgi:hypothetical protein
MANAPWEDYLNNEEKQRLALIRERRKLKEKTLNDISTEVQRIMNRAIKRMRREQGKE